MMFHDYRDLDKFFTFVFANGRQNNAINGQLRTAVHEI